MFMTVSSEQFKDIIQAHPEWEGKPAMGETLAVMQYFKPENPYIVQAQAIFRKGIPPCYEVREDGPYERVTEKTTQTIL